MNGTANDDEPGDAGANGGSSAASEPAPPRPHPAAAPRPARPPREDRLALPDDLKLRPGLVAAFDRILSRAQGQLERVDSEPQKAVHEFRKSVRRARALLALLQPSLRRRDYRQIAESLRSAHRATSGLRDSDVLLATLASLQQSAAGDAAIEQAAETWRAQLAAHSREANPPGRAAAVLRTAAADLPAIGEHFARALPARTTWRDVARGLRRTLRRAQKARTRAAGAGQDTALHDWRKRVKELNYQLEVLTRGSTVGPVTVRRQFADLAQALGEVTDILVLRAALERTAPATAGGSPGPETGPSGGGAAAASLGHFATGDVERRRAVMLAQSDELMTKPCRLFVDLLIAEARSARRALRSQSPA